MDMIAERLDMDPLELRRMNLLRDGDTVMTGEPIEDAHFRELLDDGGRQIGWDFSDWQNGRTLVDGGRKARAKGVSCIIKGTVTPSTSTAAAKLNDDGSLQVMTSSVEMGQGLQTAMAFLAAEAMALPLDRVAISTPDTDFTPYDQQTSSSRSTQAMGGAIVNAIEEIKGKLRSLASDQLEISPDDLEFANGRVQPKGAADRGLDYGEVIRRDRAGNIQGSGSFQTKGGLDPETGLGIGSVHWHQAAGAAEVEVDLETGHVTVLRYHAGVYSGRTINPVQAELQTEGNVAFGLGQALYEEMLFDNGQLQNGNLGDYMIASIEDMPRDLSLQRAGASGSQRDPWHRRDVAAACHARYRQRCVSRHRRPYPRPAADGREGAPRTCARWLTRRLARGRSTTVPSNRDSRTQRRDRARPGQGAVDRRLASAWNCG